ncbi:MAG TPA: hypothetical protein VK464_15845, partial [Symbiobacteriaceae bacterium]|nr:hypothetical protein [Symbiobacteriaceae bacterium]
MRPSSTRPGGADSHGRPTASLGLKHATWFTLKKTLQIWAAHHAALEQVGRVRQTIRPEAGARVRKRVRVAAGWGATEGGVVNRSYGQ